MNKKVKQKNLTVFEIFRRSEEAAYPELLVKYIQNTDAPLFQIEKAEMLLNIWTEEYKKMPQINKSTYYNIISRFLKLLYGVYVNRNKGAESFAMMYFVFYKKWPEATALIQKGLRQNNIQILIMLWKIAFNMIKAIKQIQRSEFGLFLSEQFQQPLSKYKWKCHAEKMYILQTLKYINNDVQYDAFIKNGKQWSEVVKAMKDEQFKSQISQQKQNDLRLVLYKYEYEQTKKDKKMNQVVTSSNSTSDKKKQEKQKSYLEKQLQKKLQKQYLSRQQINIFLVVKDKEEEQQIYRLELLSQIISNRPLLSKICEEFWESLALHIIQQFYQKLEILSTQYRMHVLLSKVFLGLLRYRKTSHIIKQKIGEQIVVKIINNIENLEKNSPFQNPSLTEIPTLVNKSFFELTPELVAQGMTFQTMISRRVKSIIDQTNAGKDDIVSRSLMTVVSKQSITLKLHMLKQIKNFLLNVKKKKVLIIQTCIILVKILLSSFNSPDYKQLNLYPLTICLTEISEIFMMNKKVNQLRKLCIQLLYLYIPIIAGNQEIDEVSNLNLVENCLKFLEVCQLHFSDVFSPTIHVLIIIINKYRDVLSSQDRCMDHFQKVGSGLMDKLIHEHNTQNMFAFLDCILKAYIKLSWNEAFHIYSLIPPESFEGWEVIYCKQARILFKKQDELKWNKKIQLQKTKKQKQQKWNRYQKKSDADKTEEELKIQDKAVEKNCEQKMSIYFGELQKKWLKMLITNHELWTKQQIIKAQLACLEFSLLQTIQSSQKSYFMRSCRPNQYMKKIILSLDEDLHNLFSYLIDSQAYQLLFLFASQIFFICRDFFFIIQLRSYQLLQGKCFQILSVFFNKVQILFACSTFTSLLLPYINNPNQLKKAYDELNKQQFITDLFKGSNQFIGKQKCYYPWLVKILMAYQITQQFRQDKKLVRQALTALGKNVAWWGNSEYIINPSIDLDDQEVKQSKILIFDAFKQQYKKQMSSYFTYLEGVIQVQKKQKQIMTNM